MSSSIFTTQAEPIAFGTQRQLFLDEYLIASRTGLVRRLHQPEKRGPVLRPQAERGQTGVQSRNAPQWNPEKGLWEWWHWGNWTGAQGQDLFFTHYAVSEDGLAWQCPVVGRYNWQGSCNNNLAMPPGDDNSMLYHVLRDDTDPDPARRFKGMRGAYQRTLLASPDGFDWQALDLPPLESYDESNLCYDPAGKQFVAIVKQGTVWGRSMALCTSPDFNTWTDHGIVIHADDTDWANRWPRVRRVVEDPAYLTPPLVDEEDYIAETYNLDVFPYQGIYIGMLNLFAPAGAIPPPQMNHTGLNQIELTMSRNLLHWRRLCNRELFLDIAPWDGINYDTQQVLPSGVPVVRDDEIWIYYNAIRFRGHRELYAPEFWPYFHDAGALALATLRLDGFVSLRPAEEEGILLTRPLQPEGGQLYVNADATNGELRVEVLDADTLAPLPGVEARPLREDAIRARIARLPASDRPIRLRFTLRNADLYAVWTDQE